MKKLLSLIFAVVMLFSLSACKKEEKKEEPKEAVKTEQKAEVKETPKEEKESQKEVKEDKKEDVKKEPVQTQTEVVEISADPSGFFASLPEKFTFVAENKDETVINIKDDGTFTGYFKGSDAQYDFSGAFSQTFPLDEFTHVSILEKYEVTNVKKGDSTSGGLANMKEVVFYIPGAPTSAISDEFLKWMPGHEKFGDKIPDNLYGIFDMVNRTGFYAQS